MFQRYEQCCPNKSFPRIRFDSVSHASLSFQILLNRPLYRLSLSLKIKTGHLLGGMTGLYYKSPSHPCKPKQICIKPHSGYGIIAISISTPFPSSRLLYTIHIFQLLSKKDPTTCQSHTREAVSPRTRG